MTDEDMDRAVNHVLDIARWESAGISLADELSFVETLIADLQTRVAQLHSHLGIDQ